MISTDYLEEERVKLWDKVLKLEKDIINKTPEYEKEARSASRSASEYRNRCDKSHNKANFYVTEINKKLVKVDALLVEIEKNELISSEKSKEIKDILGNSNENLSEIIVRKENIQGYLEHFEEIFENHPELESEVERLNTAFGESDDLISKISVLYKTSLTKKKEIDTLYYEIIGYTEKDEDSGEEVEIEGLKEKLEGTYNNLEEGFGKIKANLTELQKQTNSNFDSFIVSKEDIFTKTLDSWTVKYDSILTKITSLLPNALTVGLSYAYSEKKVSEEEESRKLARKFRTSTYGLIAVSLIPFAISVISLFNNKTLEEVIMNMPRLVLSILPLYIPVLWLAYSSNKKMNLSKRLIEEYTHKEVLSKTFEGLSTQIDNIEDVNVSADLKAKLLYNILSVSSENPGKLISDYNKSDHPLIDALDKSVKLAGAFDKLSEIPGLSSISRVLDKKSKRIIEREDGKIKEGIQNLIDKEEVLEEV